MMRVADEEGHHQKEPRDRMNRNVKPLQVKVRNNQVLKEFVYLERKILSLKGTRNLRNPLGPVLKDIESLGLNILGLEPHDSSYETIVTRALQVSMEHRELKERAAAAAEVDGVVKIEPSPSVGRAAKMIDQAVVKVAKFLYGDDMKPSKYLEGDFGPVKEETDPTHELKVVTGRIPRNMNGMMIRNGPNPPYDPVAKYSWLDGDSMLHAIYFKEGKATYVSRYVQTSRFLQEYIYDQALFLKYGDLEGPFGLFMACVQLLKARIGALDMSQGWLNGNTGLVYHNGIVMALQDFDKPYAIKVMKDGDLKTLGINNYGGRLTHNVLPHPKKDPITGEMFIIASSYTPPYARYSIISKGGDMYRSIPITTSGPTYMHDFGLTKDYVVFMDLPFCYDPEFMVTQQREIYSMDDNKKSRFGILPRYARSEQGIKWFEFDESFFIFHNANSWEEDEDKIVLIGCVLELKEPVQGVMQYYGHIAGTSNDPETLPNPARLYSEASSANFQAARSSPDPEFYSGEIPPPPKTRPRLTPAILYNGPSRRPAGSGGAPGPNYYGHNMHENSNYVTRTTEAIAEAYTSANEHTSVAAGEINLAKLYKFTFNMTTGEACMHKISNSPLDYPKVNENYIGRKTQFVYTSEFNKEIKIPSIIKFDLERESQVMKFELGENKYGSEVVFVPRQFVTSCEEDDGYLTTFVHDEKTGISFAYVICAMKMELVAVVELPNRVPYGFHAIFVNEEELQAQKKTIMDDNV